MGRMNVHPHLSPTCPFGRFACACTYQLHFFVVIVTWRRRLPLGLGLRLRLRLRLGQLGLGLRLPGVPHVRPGLRDGARGWCNPCTGLTTSLLDTCPSFLADRLHRRLHMSPAVLFGGWSAPALTHVSYLSFLADGLHRPLHISPTCPFRRMVCTGVYTCPLLVLFGGWSAQAPTHVSHLSFLADGLHKQLHMFPTCPFWQMMLTLHLAPYNALGPDGIPYTLGCPCETSTLNLFCDICGTCHQKGRRVHTGTGQEHSSYPCLPLP